MTENLRKVLQFTQDIKIEYIIRTKVHYCERYIMILLLGVFFILVSWEEKLT